MTGIAEIADKLAAAPRDELGDAATALVHAAFELPTERQRQLAVLWAEVLDAIAAGADPHTACAVLADALDERRAQGVRRVPLRHRLQALHNPERSDP